MKNGIELTRPLFDHLSEVALSVRAASHVFLFLDFDGTLAPIVEEPGAAELPPKTRELLVILTERRGFSLAIISGRALADLRQRVGLDGLIYAANHGLVICGPRLKFVEPVAVERMAELQKLSQDLGIRLSHISGANVENNGLTASVHFRKASENDLKEIRRVVDDAVGSMGELFHVTNGLMVFEIRPRVNWNKGTAVQWILIAAERPGAMPVYLGDDVTDEDAFSALPAGITVRVGRAGESSAKYHLEYQEAVLEFLTWLAELDDSPLQ
jgi:trehalose 6-phosphate phosphatase